MTVQDITKHMTALRRTITTERKRGFERRRASMMLLANLREDLAQTKLAKAIRNICNFEHKNEVFKYFNIHRNKGNCNNGIKRLEIPASWPTDQDSYDHEPDVLEDPKTATDWRETKCPTEIAFLIKLRNRLHFGQSEYDKTPFTQEPLKSKINWSASTGISELILEGTYEDSELDTISKLFLDNCTRVTDLDSLPANITFKNFQGKITKWKETTSTSPSGRHLGHYKSLFARIDSSLPDDQQKNF